MADASPAARVPGDWTLWPFEATRLPAAATAALIALGYLAASFAFMGALGADPLVRRFEVQWGFELLNGVLLGVVPAGVAHLRRGALRDFAALRPVLRVSPADFETLVEAALSVPPSLMRVASAAGVAFGIAMTAFDPGIWAGQSPPPLTHPLFLWVGGRNALICFLIARAVTTEVAMTRTYARVGAEHTAVDLLDRRPLAPFVRKGQRSALYWIVLTSVISLYFLGPSPARVNYVIPFWVVLLVTVSFVLPVRGVHRRIRATKQSELGRVNESLRRERERLFGAAGPADARLANLVAYRELVEQVREWPFDASTLLRFALYVAVGLGSWLGSALVERLLDTALE